MKGTRIRHGGLYRPAPSPLRPGPLSVVLALAFAAATLAVVPAIRMLAAPPEDRVVVRDAPVVVAPPPRPDRLPPPPEEEEPQAKEKPVPRLVRGPRVPDRPQDVRLDTTALALPLASLAVDLGDVALHFGVENLKAGPVVAAPRAPRRPPPPPRVPDRQATAVFRPEPTYPLHARQRGIEGFVELSLTIGADGKVKEARVLRSEPAGVFDETTRKAALRWRYEPAIRNGRPTTARKRQIVRFRLGDRR
jgi:protein TonB